jgi:hypothetical protein
MAREAWMTHRAISSCLACFVIGSAVSLVAAPLNPCAMLTPAQVSAVLGGTISGPTPIGSKGCLWRQEGKAGVGLLQLDVTLLPPDRFAHTKSVTIGTVDNVSGLGADAFYNTLKTGHVTSTTLNVKKGDTFVVIRVSGDEKRAEQYQAKEKAIAQVLVPKL